MATVTGDIEYTGLNDLPQDEQVKFKEYVERYVPKLESKLNNKVHLQAHIKIHEPDGRIKYSLHFRLSTPTVSLVSNMHHGYDLRKVAHEALDSLSKEIYHRYGSEKKSLLRRVGRLFRK